MALSASATLAATHFRSTWNQVIRQAGFGGEIATWVMLAVVAGTLFFPALLTFRIGLDLGGELAASGDAGILRTWNGLMGVFTAGFAVLGGFRQKPAFPFARFGRYPLTPLELLIADLPSSLFEVFPMMSAAAILFLNAALVFRMPEYGLVVVMLTMSGIVTMLSVMIIASGFWSAIARRRIVLFAVIALIFTLPLVLGAEAMRAGLKERLPALAQRMPLARGYAGLLALRAGSTAAGVAGIALASLSSLALLVAAAYVQKWRLVSEMEGPATRTSPERALQFKTPASAISLLFVRQLLGSAATRAHLFIPLFFTAPIALVHSLSRAAAASGKPVPEVISGFMARAGELPLHAILPLLVVAMNPQIWMNQFGWDRGGIRTVLLLPIEPRAILVGKMRGVSLFMAFQTAIAAVPLFWVRTPDVREIVTGLAAGGFAFVISAAVGHVVSMRFSRAIDGLTGAQIPMHLSWISPSTMIVIVGWLAGVHAIGELAAKGAGLFALVLSLAGALAGYRAILPRLGAMLSTSSERMISM